MLQLAKEHEKARELERLQRYYMPLEKGKVAPELEVPDNEPPQSEQSKWESDQMSSAVFRFGAKDRKGTWYSMTIRVKMFVFYFLLISINFSTTGLRSSAGR